MNTRATNLEIAITTPKINSFRASFFQPKLIVNQPNDIYEREADTVADRVVNSEKKPTNETFFAPLTNATKIQRKCAACEDEDQKVQRKSILDGISPIVQNKGHGSNVVSEGISQQIYSSKGNGNAMDSKTLNFMNNEFEADLSGVKIHTDSNAIQMSKDLNARAFTLGNDIYFNQGEYNPNTQSGKHLLAHELTHTLQQARGLQLSPVVQRSTIAAFKSDLEAMSRNHAIVIRELFLHPRFVPLITYLGGCPAGIIDFQVTRIQQRVRGRLVDLFGGFDPSSGSGPSNLTVNPFRPEHVSNPMEVVDTIVHESIHAILDLNSVCTSSSNPFPLASNILDAPHDPELAPLMAAGGHALDRGDVATLSAGGTMTASGANVQEFLQNNYGPSASRPETHFVDLNMRGQELVTAIISDIRRAHPSIGAETVSFDNLELTRAAALLGSRSWLNAAQNSYSSSLFKNQVANKRRIDPATFTEREYSISAIQTVEFADSARFDPNTSGGWGVSGGVWQFNKKSRFTGQLLHTYVTGTRSSRPGGSVGYNIIQHT